MSCTIINSLHKRGKLFKNLPIYILLQRRVSLFNPCACFYRPNFIINLQVLKNRPFSQLLLWALFLNLFSVLVEKYLGETDLLKRKKIDILNSIEKFVFFLLLLLLSKRFNLVKEYIQGLTLNFRKSTANSIPQILDRAIQKSSCFWDTVFKQILIIWISFLFIFLHSIESTHRRKTWAKEQILQLHNLPIFYLWKLNDDIVIDEIHLDALKVKLLHFMIVLCFFLVDLSFQVL